MATEDLRAVVSDLEGGLGHGPSLFKSLLAGGAAGTCVDLAFFPIDTVKTRLQAKEGFFRAGGWKGVYQGVGSVIVASAPGAALFFLSYDQGKHRLPLLFPSLFGDRPALTHMAAASMGEIAACSVRVPSEIVKQRVQAGHFRSSLQSLMFILRNRSEGRIRGLYRGYGTTLMREIPFTAIQFPLYERFKVYWADHRGKPLQVWQGGLCGSVAGGIAAAVTTPLDVLKTRMMLSETRTSLAAVLRDVAADGPGAFFRGVVPRTLWISAGGAVFLGTYELASSLL